MHRGRWIAVTVGVAVSLGVGGACGDDGEDAAGGGAVEDGTDGTRDPTVTDGTSTPTSATAALGAIGEGDLAGVEVSADVVVDESSLDVSYVVRNDSDQVVVVADAVPVARGAGEEPELTGAWVTASTEGIVTIGKWPIAVPRDADEPVEARHIYLARLDPGATVQGTVQVAWPLVGNHPYFADQLPVPLPDPVGTVRLCLGIEPISPAVAGSPSVEEDGHTWLDVPMDQLTGVLCTEPASLD